MSIKRSKYSIESVGSDEEEDKIYKCERILKMRYNYKLNRKEYLLKWLGYSERESTWEPKENILDKRLMEEFKQRIRNSILNVKPADALTFDKEVFDSEKVSNKTEKDQSFKQPKQPLVNKILKIRSKSNQSNSSESETISSETRPAKKRRPSLPNEESNLDSSSKPPLPKAKDTNTYKYLNGQEPKILKEYKDETSGELMFEIKWKYSNKSDIVLAHTIQNKYPQVVQRFKERFKDAEPEEVVDLFMKDGEMKFLVRLKNKEELKMVTASMFKLKYPQLVIRFYEAKTIFEKPAKKH